MDVKSRKRTSRTAIKWRSGCLAFVDQRNHWVAPTLELEQVKVIVVGRKDAAAVVPDPPAEVKGVL